MEKLKPGQHLETQKPDEKLYADQTLESVDDVNDEKRNRQLNRGLDLRVLPLCCWVYLLNFLDR